MKRAVLLALLAGGCVAADPDTIQPMSISPVGYSALDCPALAAEDRRVAERLGPLIRAQDTRRGHDAIGIIAIGISPTGIGRPEHSAEIARLKGERETIASVKASKGCIEPQAPVVTKFVPSAEQLAEAKRRAAMKKN
jgi:hypothetical protein